MDVDSQSHIVFCCISIDLEVYVWIFVLQSFNLRMPLISSQHFPVVGGLTDHCVVEAA